MPLTLEPNPTFTLAAQLVNNTNQSIFLTGKAGTGKTTFLKHIKENTIKNTVVVAPTGVAAINAGGVTMHSFFQLPFGPYIPQSHSASKFNLGQPTNVADKNTLFANIRFDNNKRKLLNELQLLIIDEISMVRADTLDAVDAILRHFRRNYEVPFGGVQVLYIGDMYQLPPVIKEEEWQLLSEYYNSPFFFSAKVAEALPPLYVELNKVYRQTDQLFIDILNRVRNNIPTPDDLEILNDCYNPNINYSNSKSILLTTHNYKANNVNQAELYKLNSIAQTYRGVIEGDFNEKLLPNDYELELKEGAQIMFIKNDSSSDKKYYNGKLATVHTITPDKVTVLFTDDKEPYTIKKESWKNVRYKLSASSQIEEEELGSYTQYPIRLAWAVTIHKSQGLTFTNVVIDAGQSFAAGQVYVALSRCTTLSGIALHSHIVRSSITTDARIVAYAKQAAKTDELQRVLDLEKDAYMQQQLIQLFNLNKIVLTIQAWVNIIPTKKLPHLTQATQISSTVLNNVLKLEKIAQQFEVQLKQIFATFIIPSQNKHPTNTELLAQRCTKGVAYFVTQTIQQILQPIQQHLLHTQELPKVKAYTLQLQDYEKEVWQYLTKLNLASYNNVKYGSDVSALEPYNPANRQQEKKINLISKIPTAQLSLNMLLEGNNIEQIAVVRGMVQSTIEGHLAQFVRTGQLPIQKLLSKVKLEAILKVYTTLEDKGFKTLKDALNENITYSDIRAAVNHYMWLQEEAEKKGVL